ncbi:MAG: hypothetical protein ACYTGB_12765 [Planctomycetota bacterium]|jgi:sugar lactone lactonase YvrE
MRKTAFLLVVLTFSLAATAGEAVKFTTKPAAKKAGDKVTVSFAASKATDVAVYVLDAKGKCVRHLAAGVIGGKGKPPAPLKPGLSQSLEWDLRDDAGKPARGGPFKVRVTLGTKFELDTFLLDVPAATGRIGGVAAGPKGEIYLWHHDCTANGNQGSYKLKVVARDGKYLRTLQPYPATLPKEKAKVFQALTDADGNLVPVVHNLQQLALTNRGYSARGKTLNSSGCVDAKGRAYWLVAGARLAALEADGSPVYDQFPTKSLLPDFKAARGWGSLCMSGDGKSLYFAGLANAKNRYDKSAKTASCVWRVDLASLKTEVFLGDPAKPGKEKGALTAPNSVAVAKGMIYVADRGAERIVVFKEADKSYVGEIKVKAPISIGVDPSSGAVYVSVRTGKNISDLVKFGGYQSGKEVARVKLPKSYNTPRIAVDSSARPVRILAPTLKWRGTEINCYEDAGAKLEPRNDPRDLKGPWAPGPRDLTVDRARGELYIKFGEQMYYRLDVKTGKVLDTIKLRGVAGDSNANATQLIASPDGSLITLSWRIGLRRLDRKGKPLNWEGRDTNAIPFGGIMTFQQRYMAVPNPNEIFVMLPAGYRAKKKASKTCLNVLDTAGKTKRTIIWLCSQGAVPRVDPKGNIYIADMVQPPDRSWPELFDAAMKKKYRHTGKAAGNMAHDPGMMTRFWTSSMYGSIIKFPPEGGIIWYNKEVCVDAEGKPSAELLAKPKVTYGRHIGYNFKPVDVQGAEWVRFGWSPYGEARGAGFCNVDGFGRVFYPNMGQFRIEVVDTNNNWIGSFGRYGNADAPRPGPETKIGGSEIPFAWPTYVAVDDEFAFVNDTLSNRTARVKLGAEVEEICAVR